MKKFISFAFAAMMLVAVASCDSKPKYEETEKAPYDTVQVDSVNDTVSDSVAASDSVICTCDE